MNLLNNSVINSHMKGLFSKDLSFRGEASNIDVVLEAFRAMRFRFAHAHTSAARWLNFNCTVAPDVSTVVLSANKVKPVCVEGRR